MHITNASSCVNISGRQPIRLLVHFLIYLFHCFCPKNRLQCLLVCRSSPWSVQCCMSCPSWWLPWDPRPLPIVLPWPFVVGWKSLPGLPPYHLGWNVVPTMLCKTLPILMRLRVEWIDGPGLKVNYNRMSCPCSLCNLLIHLFPDILVHDIQVIIQVCKCVFGFKV